MISYYDHYITDIILVIIVITVIFTVTVNVNVNVIAISLLLFTFSHQIVSFRHIQPSRATPSS